MKKLDKLSPLVNHEDKVRMGSMETRMRSLSYATGSKIAKKT